MNFLLLILCVLLISGTAYLLYRISYLLLRQGQWLTPEKLSSLNAWLLPGFLVSAFALLFWYIRQYEWPWLPLLASRHGVMIDNMFWVTMGLTGFVFLLTQFLLFYFAFRFRSKKGQRAYYQKNNQKIEIIWTSIPLLTFILLFIFSHISWKKIHAPKKDCVNIEIMAEQFNWRIRYSGRDNILGNYDYRLINDENNFGIDFTDTASLDDFSSVQLHLPKDVPVRLHIRSRDVIHSVYLPNFRVKMDAVPGMPTSFVFTPTITTDEMRDKTGLPDFNYELACAELCGRMHFAMLLIVVVEERELFEQWARSQKPRMRNRPLYYSEVKQQRCDAMEKMERPKMVY